LWEKYDQNEFGLIFYEIDFVFKAVERLGGAEVFSPHQVELALWTHHILLTYKPDLLKDLPIADGNGELLNDNEPTQNTIQQPQEDSLGSAISSDSNKEGLTGTEDSNSNSNQEALNHG